MTSVLRLLAAVLAAVLLVACGDEDEPLATDDGTTVPGGAALAEEYVSVEVSEDGTARPLVEGTTITLRFVGDQVAASLGCNQLGAPYEIDGDRLVVEQLSMTEMGCDPERHAQDQWFAELLQSGPTITLGGDRLTLSADGTAVVLVDREVAEPDASLVGTTWEVDGFADGQDPEDTAMSLSVPEPGMVRFEDDGFISGKDGCNQFGYGGDEGAPPGMGRSYEVEGDRLVFTGDRVSHTAGCADLEEYTERFWAALTGTVTWSIDADRLTLVSEDGRSMTLRAVD